MKKKSCRYCNSVLNHTFVDLGMSPLSNAFVEADMINNSEVNFPLYAFVCSNCFLVQLEEFESPDKIFSDYAYFSSYSDSWLNHANEYVDMIIPKLALNEQSFVIEIASNDGYLLKNFIRYNIPVLGIEPAENVAEIAKNKGVNTLVSFFNTSTAHKLVSELKKADLIIGNNVLAHVPDLKDFVKSLKIILKPHGVITLEFPHLLKLIEGNQFDTIYHEHFSYFSLLTVNEIFKSFELEIFNVEELNTHGGSLRIFVRHKNGETSGHIDTSVKYLLEKEVKYGLSDLETYLSFSENVKATKRDLLEYLVNIKNKGKSIVGYGAPAKGNTLLNYCGIRNDFLDYTVDRNPFKQGKFLPGTRIPIFEPEKLKETKPDYILILPWNLKNEIINQISFVREWGCKFLIPIPTLQVI